MSRREIENFIVSWNARFPVDRWWREKHKVPFNSQRHRESNFKDQLFEYYEDQLFSKLLTEDDEAEKYNPNEGDWLKVEEPVTIEDKIKNALSELEEFKNRK